MKELIYSTQSLQINSLCEFARTLGYVPRDMDMLSRGFEIVDMRSWHTHYISFENMIALHNNQGLQSHLFMTPLWIRQLDLPCEQFDKAQECKLVDQVKLQRDKNTYGGVKCQSHMIKLTDKGREYCAQFPRYDILFYES